MNGSRVAMVFAHPGHEILVAGMMQRFRPHLLFLTRSDSGGDAGREDLAREGLERLGLAGRATFVGLSEVESYSLALAGESARYLALRGRIADWLREVRPTVVFGDAFELSNFHHDLGRALLDGALEEYARTTSVRPENYELPLVCRTEPGVWQLRLQEFPAGPFEVFELTDEEAEKKRDLVRWLGLRRAEAALAASRFPPIEREVYRAVPAGRDYACPPPGLQRHYDDWGRLQVGLGKHSRPLLFEEHFVPLIRVLGPPRPGASGGRTASSIHSFPD